MVSIVRMLGRRLLALAGVVALAAVPFVVWHDLISQLAGSFRLDVGYLVTAWGGFALMAVGVVALLPVALTSGGNPGGRFYPRRRDNLTGWATSLYLLGGLLVLQVGAIAAGA